MDLSGREHQQRESHHLAGSDQQCVLGDEVLVLDRGRGGGRGGLGATEPAEVSLMASRHERAGRDNLVDDVEMRVVVVDEESQQ